MCLSAEMYSGTVFLSLFPGYVDAKRIKVEVSSESLEDVLGKNWNVYKYANSSTQIRIIGNVSLLYRRKMFPPKTFTRYTNTVFRHK